ncbi:MAG: hypothetical protein ACOCYU_05865 [Brevefilum sp.]
MKFLKQLMINLVLLVGLGIFLYVLFPDVMKGVFDVYGQLFGPLAVVMLVVFALPKQKRRKG